MAIIEPGIYRIVNVGRGRAITVPAGNTSTIVGWETPNQSGQQWFVRCSGDKYHILDCVHGRHIVLDSTTFGAKACLGAYPTLWEIIPAKEATYQIKLVGHNLVLDSISDRNNDPINVFNEDANCLQRTWRFEKLGSLPSDESELVRFGATERAQILEQLAQKDKQLVELAGRLADLAGQLADQNQRIADQNQRIADQTQRIVDQNQKISDQEGEISALKRQTEEKDQQLVQANREVGFVLARAVQREESLYRDRILGSNSWGFTDRTPGESVSLRDEVERLKSLVIQLMDKDNKTPNNMSRV